MLLLSCSDQGSLKFRSIEGDFFKIAREIRYSSRFNCKFLSVLTQFCAECRCAGSILMVVYGSGT